MDRWSWIRRRIANSLSLCLSLTDCKCLFWRLSITNSKEKQQPSVLGVLRLIFCWFSSLLLFFTLPKTDFSLSECHTRFCSSLTSRDSICDSADKWKSTHNQFRQPKNQSVFLFGNIVQFSICARWKHLKIYCFLFNSMASRTTDTVCRTLSSHDSEMKAEIVCSNFLWRVMVYACIDIIILELIFICLCFYSIPLTRESASCQRIVCIFIIIIYWCSVSFDIGMEWRSAMRSSSRATSEIRRKK